MSKNKETVCDICGWPAFVQVEDEEVEGCPNETWNYCLKCFLEKYKGEETEN